MGRHALNHSSDAAPTVFPKREKKSKSGVALGSAGHACDHQLTLHPLEEVGPPAEPRDFRKLDEPQSPLK